MSTPAFNRKPVNIKKYSAGKAYIVELDEADNPDGDYVRLDRLKETTIAQEEEEYSENDDTGGVVMSSTTVKSVSIESTFISRDEKIRQMFNNQDATQSTREKFFGLVYIGAKLKDSANGDTTEIWVFQRVRVSQAFSYQIGGEAKFNVKFIPLKNDGPDKSFPLPSSADGYDLTTTGTVTIESGDFFYTADIP